jgi:hypothetical protein
MLWSRPTRAQPPIVDVVKWTFAAARMACASDRVIQSAADGIGQSEVLAGALVDAPGFDGFDGSFEESPAPVAAGTDESPRSDDDPESADDPFSDADEFPSEALSSPLPWDELALTAVRRSLFAHPDPL